MLSSLVEHKTPFTIKKILMIAFHQKKNTKLLLQA